MKEALRRIKSQVLAGILLSGIAGAAAYTLEQRDVRVAAERTVSRQIAEIEERLSLARAELDSVSSFIAQADPDIAVARRFIGGLSLSQSQNVPWLWSLVVPDAEIEQLVRRIRGQPEMEQFAFKGQPSTSPLLAPIVLVSGSFDAGLVGTDLAAVPDFAELASEDADPSVDMRHERLMTISGTGFPADTFYMARVIGPAPTGSRSAARSSVLLRGLTASNLLRSAGLLDGQYLRLVDASGNPPRPLLVAGKQPEAASWLPTMSFNLDSFRLALSLSPPPDLTRPKWWILVTFSCLLVTGLYAALRSGFMVGERVSQLGSILNSTELRLAETARREVAFFESTGTANCETDFATGTLIRVNDALCSLLGYQRDELTGKTFGDITHPDDVPMSNAALLDESGQPRKNLQFEKRYLRKDGSIVWALVNSKLFCDANGHPRSYMTVIININDRKRDETTKALLTRELAHRVRNTVQLTSSLARQTAATAKSVRDYDIKFHRRLAALSAAQDILFDRNWMSAPLSRIAQATFKPFMPEDLKQGALAVDLPDVELSTQQAQTIAIALHELASNSSRYGALSNGGSVSVSATMKDDVEGTPVLHLRWDERSSRPVRKPRRAGFGTRMLMSAMPEQFGGVARCTWRATGLLYEASLGLPGTET